MHSKNVQVLGLRLREPRSFEQQDFLDYGMRSWYEHPSRVIFAVGLYMWR
jgi:hypothetical protein